MMIYSKSGLHLTEGFEQCRLEAYQDQGGIWTIGWGHTGPDVRRGLTCTQAEADTWLMLDLANSTAVINHLVKVPLTQDEFDALVDFVYNVGASNFWHSTLLHKLNASDYLGAANEFDRWDHVSGQAVKGLFRRREKERLEFVTSIAEADHNERQWDWPYTT